MTKLKGANRHSPKKHSNIMLILGIKGLIITSPSDRSKIVPVCGSIDNLYT